MSTAQPAIITRSARGVRLAAVAPRVLALSTVALLALVGLRALVTGPPGPHIAPAPAITEDLAAEAYAQAFVRTFLTWSAGDSDGYAEALSPFVQSQLQESLATPGTGSQRVLWTSVARDEPARGGGRDVEVEAGTSRGTVFVSVPVRRENGSLYLANYPAIVGGPATTTEAELPAEDDVSDTGLETVLRRAVTNYVEGQGSDLRADLSPGAVVSLPSLPLRVRSIDQVTWAGPGRAAVALTAVSPDQTAWSLRYELGVEKTADRWYVTEVGNP